MRYSKYVPAVLAVAALAAGASRVEAAGQHRGPGGGGVGRAVPRTSRPIVVAPRIVGVVPYRPYYYPYRPGLTVGFYSGYPYGYGYYPYPYPYASYGYGPYGYPLPPAGYVTAARGVPYGGVRIQGAPRDAQIFADGYYVGIVDDFDGVFQHLNLEAGPHRIEIRAPGYPPVEFEVRVEPGQTITYHADVGRRP